MSMKSPKQGICTCTTEDHKGSQERTETHQSWALNYHCGYKRQLTRMIAGTQLHVSGGHCKWLSWQLLSECQGWFSGAGDLIWVGFTRFKVVVGWDQAIHKGGRGWVRVNAMWGGVRFQAYGVLFGRHTLGLRWSGGVIRQCARGQNPKLSHQCSVLANAMWGSLFSGRGDPIW